MEPVVITRDLTKAFGSFLAVDHLNIAISAGEVCGFLGPNGAGKSTTIRMLCGILEPTSGSGSVMGHDLRREAEAIKRRIGYMSQKYSLYDDLTVYENLEFYAGIYGVPARERRTRIAEMIEQSDLSGRERQMAGTLSGGYKQRLALGCALIARPSLVFLDEPTSGVSPTARRHFFSIIQSLADAGTTVIVTTHFMDEAERCDRIAFFSRGRLTAFDTPDKLKKSSLNGCLAQITIPLGITRVGEIQAQAYVRECTVHGNSLHVLLQDDKALPALEEFTGATATVITPSLEDVFVHLAREKATG